MARSRVDIKLLPDRCDHCGHCQRACERGALKVGASYLYLDWRTCDECMRCVEVCDRGAIVRHSAAAGKAGPSRRSAAGHRATGAAAEKSAQRQPSRPVPRRRAPGESGRTGHDTVPEAAPRRADAEVIALPSVGPVAWTPLEAIAMVVVALATFFGKDALLGTDLIAAMPPDGRVLARVAVLVVFYSIQVGVLAFLAHKHKATLPSSVGLTRVRTSPRAVAGSVGWVLLLLVATRLSAWVWGVIAQAIGIQAPGTSEGGLTEVFGTGMAGMVLSVLLVVIVAPLAEEMLFRGVLLTAIGSRLGAGIALVGQAVLFGAYHFSVWMFVPTFLLGLACGYLAQHRGSLWPSVVLHALFNAVPVAIAFLLAG